jgi:hypothetical protein
LPPKLAVTLLYTISGGVIVFDEAQVKVHKSKLAGKPVLVQIEGTTPTEDQLKQCRQLWSALHETFGFNMATFCPALLPYSLRRSPLRQDAFFGKCGMSRQAPSIPEGS